MKIIASLALFAGMTGIGMFFVSGTLDDMTHNDCNAGIQRACEQLAKK